MLRIVVALVLLAHGIGHSEGPLQVFKVVTINPQWHGDSWLLSGAIGATPAQVIGVVLWLGALVGFALLSAVVMGWLPATWWQPLAVASAVTSLIGVIFFPIAFPLFSTIGAVVVDLGVLVAVLGYGWVPSSLPA